MFKVMIALFVTCVGSGYAKTRDIPETTRRAYAEKFHNAFALQCNGLSTKAFWMFDEASKAATKAGEEAEKINVL
ncbi:MAG TPA: hypothetical protein VGO47_04555, partial [Chlamydiales bacterium]|jgi:hypothetical protein|nr:hypothetical protein [Chlamydiales bacterium]